MKALQRGLDHISKAVVVCFVRKFPPTHYYKHFDGSGTAPLSLWVAQFLLGGQTQTTSFLGKDRLMEKRGFRKPFLSLLPPGKKEQSFHAARFPGLLSQSLINHGRPAIAPCHSSTLPFAVINLIYQQRS